MDNNITVRFFRIRPNHRTVPPFEEALGQIFASSVSPVEREQDVGLGGGSVILRLERFVQDGQFVAGEMVRRQTRNFPPEANDDGLNLLPLSDGGGLGHCAAFRYSIPLGIIAIQFDNRAVSMGRMLAYMREFDIHADYAADALVREDSWARYGRGQPRKLSFTIAQPQNLGEVEGNVHSAVESSRRLAELYNAPIITVEVSMGRRDGHLNGGYIRRFIRYLTSDAAAGSDVRNIEVNVKPDDGGEVETINFLDELLRVKSTLDLPDDDIDRNYKIRSKFVRTCFNENLPYMREVYGDEA